MADDAIFEPQPSGAPSQEGGAPPTAADLTRQLAIGIQQAQAPLAQEVAALRQEVAAARAQGTPEPTPAPTEGGQDPYFSRFLSQPREAIAEVMNERLGPVVAPLADALVEAQVDKSRTSVVGRWGEKAWSEVVEPRLRHQLVQLRQNDPRAASNPMVAKHIVQSILGTEELADTLEKHRQDTLAAAAEAAKRREAPMGTLGAPGRSTAGWGAQDDDALPLSDADRTFLDGLARAGYNWTEKDYRAARKQPRDMEARYEAEMKAAKAARAAAGGR